MNALSPSLRKQLERTVGDAREVAEMGARAALESLAVHYREPYHHMSSEERILRRRLRAHGRQLGDRRDSRSGIQPIDRLVHECAYEHWHSMLFARFLADNHLLIEPELGIAITLEECEELGKDENLDKWTMAARFAHQMLPQVFRPAHPAFEVRFAREHRLKLERFIESLPAEIFVATDALGWVYQFWQSRKKDEVNRSGDKIGADELPAVTQLFTEPYMVAFLLDNTLGAWWAARRLTDVDLSVSSGEAELRRKAAIPGVPLEYLRFVRRSDATEEAHRPSESESTIADRHGQAKVSGESSTPADGALAPSRDLFGVDDTLLSAPLRNSMDTLYELFAQAPVLGSLIDPTAIEADLFQHDFESIRELFAVVLKQERRSDEEIERAVAAHGMARAAHLLSNRYTLVITNVPYLARRRHGEALRTFCDRHYSSAKNELATVFLERCLRLRTEGGTASLVLPQNWLFLIGYRKLRESLLRTESWHLLTRLGAGAFETISGEVVKLILLTLGCGHDSMRVSGSADDSVIPRIMYGLDVSVFRNAREKSAHLSNADIQVTEQNRQLKNPDARITSTTEEGHSQLATYVMNSSGSLTGDGDHYYRFFWEQPMSKKWQFLQTTLRSTRTYGGRLMAILWEEGKGSLFRHAKVMKGMNHAVQNWRRGQEVWNHRGVAVSSMGELPSSLYSGCHFDNNVAVLRPKNEVHLPAIWSFCSSPEYNEAVRRIDPKLNVTNATLAKVPFDLDRWTKVANQQYPNGLPCPYSDDPSQWIFHGHPCGSVVWDETQRQAVEGALRTDPIVLQIAVARLLGFRWPAEHDVDMELAGEQREWVRRTESLLEWMDEDGIVCIPSVRGELPARDRLLGLLAAAFGDFWIDGVLAKLLANVGSNSLDDWLRDCFFDEHCKLFHHRPFVWHIWDGRRRDGFHALVSYHKLIAADGKGRQLLESLTYSYLGDWITRQRDNAQRGEEGAEDRLAAARELQKRLEAILKGEPPFDLFVRWKPIHEQPIGWEPDINDGVRLNIRPFMADDIPGGKKGAGILRAKPKIGWNKDRGKEVLKPVKRSRPPWLRDEEEVADLNEDQELRPREDYPWFWTCPGDGPRTERTDFPGGSRFDGNRWNNLHYTNTMKSAAGEREWATTRKLTRERRDDAHLAATDEQGAGGPSGQ